MSGVFAKQYAYNSRFFRVIQVSSGVQCSKCVWLVGGVVVTMIEVQLQE
jgi:hypothetical protein